jgi:hypothetical protein
MKKYLLSTAAAALLLSGGAAMAASDGPVMPERAPAAQRSAPAEKIAPPINAGERKAPETTGQGSKDLSPGHSATDGQGSSGMKSGDKNETAGQGSHESGAAKSGTSDKGDMKAQSDKKAGTSESTKDGSRSSDSSKNASESTNGANRKAEDDAGMKSDRPSQKSSESSQSSTTGQGAAAGAAKLTTQQRTKITTVIKKQNVKRIQPSELNVSIRVGATVPTSVHYYPLPSEVIEIYPEWRGYDYILVGDQIIVIEPGRHVIVAVLAA